MLVIMGHTRNNGDMLPDKPIIPVSYPALLLDILQERGIDPAQAMANTGVALDTIQQPGALLRPSQYEQFARNVLELTREPGLGYEFGLRFRPTTHGFVGYAAMCCNNLRDAIELAIRFLPLRAGPALTMQLKESGDQASISLTANYDLGELRHLIFESTLLGLLLDSAHLLGLQIEQLQDIEIWLDWPEPDYFANYKDRLPPTRYGMSACQVQLPRHYLDQPLLMANPSAAQQAVSFCERELALIEQQRDADIVLKVREVLQIGAEGYPSVERVAARLHMSTRTLKRRLQQHDTNYHRILRDVRLRDAIKLLRKPDLPLNQVAAGLGYNDPANFTRAFKRWTGATPSEYREEYLRGNKAEDK